VDGTQEEEDAWPAWSPDGSRIAFTRAEFLVGKFGTPTSIWIADADGARAQRVTEYRVWGPIWPVWSPDGRIAFTEADGYLMATRIRVMNADGSMAVTLLESEKDQIVAHDWSADGRWLLFTKKGDIHLLNVTERTVFRITADGASGTPVFAPSARAR
jgi:Tol biopolymer transport system component